jgi:DNA-binding LacI/PurR family transcriptional regulator
MSANRDRRRFPTIRDIARDAGVSHQAVSLALNGRPGVSAKLRHRIVALADKLGYYPQEAARILASKQAGQIGIVIAHQPEHVAITGLQGGLLALLIDLLEKRGRRYHIEFHHHSEDRDASHMKLPRALTGGMLDGAILLGDVGKFLRNWLTKRKLPYVSFNEPGACSVIADEAHGMRLALDHLATLGHRCIAGVFGPQRYTSHRLRYRAFLEHQRVLGLRFTPELALRLNTRQTAQWPELQLAWARALLKRADRPTAFIGAGHAVAWAGLELGLRAPRDFSLLDWIGTDVAESSFFPPVMAIYADLDSIARQIVELLDTLLAGEVPAEPNRVVPSLLFPGGSTGPAPRVV